MEVNVMEVDLAEIFTEGAAMLTSVRVEGLTLHHCFPPLLSVVKLELVEHGSPRNSGAP